jgi:indolepyruvate ferredoxin oxidoreductase
MDERFLQESGTQAYTGSELLLKGAIEGGVALVTGYPGSPLADFFEVPPKRQQLLNDYGIVFQMANNEALAAARLNGSQMADLKAMAVIKSVGAHVAADGLSLGNLSKHGRRGGAIVVIGDDPWNESTQVPADSRYIAQHMHIPVIEPSTFQEIKDWVRYGFDLSARSNLLVAYLVTTNQADGGGTVTVHPNMQPSIHRKKPVELDPSTFALDESLMLPPRTSAQEATLPRRHDDLLQQARLLGVNRCIAGTEGANIGFVSAGMSYCYLAQALDELGLTGKFPILKLGVSYPIDAALAIEFAQGLTEIIVVEEKRPFIESQLTHVMKDAVQREEVVLFPRIWGKEFPEQLEGFPSHRGLNPSIVMERLAQFFVQCTVLPTVQLADMHAVLQQLASTQQTRMTLPTRTPTFCPGCPHRDSSSVFKDIQTAFKDSQYMRRTHHRGSVDLVFHGDTGCYTMLMFEPNTSLMHNYSGMGLGGGTGAGIDPFIVNKQVVFMGDGTFFHSGMVAISDSLKHAQDITYVILDNKTTAMTGHQPAANVDTDVAGRETVVQEIETVLQGFRHNTGLSVSRANPGYHDAYRELLEETILQPGVKVVIADKECGITYNRRRSRERRTVIETRGYVARERRINITPEVCEYCLECTKSTGCPGLTIVDTSYGKKIATDISNCVEDTACMKGYACPAFEEVIVHRTKAPKRLALPAISSSLPEPIPRAFDKAWYGYVAGVGGMGIGVITAVLVRAGMRDGYVVKFSDRKGLAIRNGGVYSYVAMLKHDHPISPIIPYGQADVLLGMDMLEAVRAIDPSMHFQVAHPSRTIALINTFRMPTVEMLIGRQPTEDQSELEAYMREMTRSDAYYSADLSHLSEERFGSNLYANMIMLGLAYQQGVLPVSRATLEWAIGESVPPRVRGTNLAAFTVGRELVLGTIKAPQKQIKETLDEVLERKIHVLQQGSQATRNIAHFTSTVADVRSAWHVPESFLALFARRYADLIEYDNITYAARYHDLVDLVYTRDCAEYGWRATKMAIQYVHKVMAIKDEVYVSHLLLSPEKLARDRVRYNIDPTRGDRLEYIHVNRPEFVIGRWRIAVRLHTRNWQLRIMRRAKFLRSWLPQWHKAERDFRDWYIDLVEHFQYHDEASYERYADILGLPEEVRGYRDVRYPTMDRAREQAKVLQAGMVTGGRSAMDRAPASKTIQVWGV